MNYKYLIIIGAFLCSANFAHAETKIEHSCKDALFDIADIFLRLRGTVPPPCRRSAFYVAVEAENGCYTWLRLRASRGLPRPSAVFRGFPRPSALRIACTFRAHSAPSANRGTFRNFRAWPSMTRPTE